MSRTNENKLKMKDIATISHRPAAALIFYTLLLCFKAPMRAFMSVWVPFVMCRNSLLRVAVPRHNVTSISTDCHHL